MKRFFIIFAAILLVSVSAFAQSKTPLKGDVNEDGVVDVADIVAVISIMKANAGPVTTYYWYVGQTDPSTMSSISPIVNDMTSPGWRLIGSSVPTYSASNKLWNADNIITTGSSLDKQYVAIPSASSACPRDGIGNDASTVDMYNRLSDVTISGVSYKIYQTVGKSKKFAIDIY